MRARLALASILLIPLVATAVVGSASATVSGFPSPTLVRRLADRDLLLTRPLPTDHPRVTVREAIAAARRGGLGFKPRSLIYAVRLARKQTPDATRLVWLLISPHMKIPILSGRGPNSYYADVAQVVDATNGRWEFATRLGP